MITREDFEVALALDVLHKYRSRHQNDEGFVRVRELIELLMDTAKNPPVCSNCGSAQDWYVITRK